MVEECKIPLGTGVHCSNYSESKKVVQYFKSTGVINSNCLEGSAKNCYYGRNYSNIIDNHDQLTGVKGKVDKLITFEEFEELVSKPLDQIRDSYDIY